MAKRMDRTYKKQKHLQLGLLFLLKMHFFPQFLLSYPSRELNFTVPKVYRENYNFTDFLPFTIRITSAMRQLP